LISLCSSNSHSRNAQKAVWMVDFCRHVLRLLLRKDEAANGEMHRCASSAKTQRLVLFPDRLGVGFAVWVEEFLASFLPCCFQFRCGDVPVRSTFLKNGAQVLAQFFQSGTPEEPIAHVDFMNDQTRFEDDRVRDHGIVERVGVFSDVEVFLDFASRIGEEGPVGTNTAAIFIRLGNVVGAES
jgi:hypothetical protein